MEIQIKRGMGKIENASQAKAILEKVPHEKWIEGYLGISNVIDDEIGNSCALGHMNRYCNTQGELLPNVPFNNPCYYGNNDNYDDISGLDQIAVTYMASLRLLNPNNLTVIPDINDTVGKYGYTEKHAKDRIIHLLDDMIAAGY